MMVVRDQQKEDNGGQDARPTRSVIIDLGYSEIWRVKYPPYRWSGIVDPDYLNQAGKTISNVHFNEMDHEK